MEALMTDDLNQLTAAYLARQTTSIRLWFIEIVLDAAFGWDDCERRRSTPLENYPAPVRVQAIARTLRSWLNDAAESGIDPLEYISSAARLDLADELRHC